MVCTGCSLLCEDIEEGRCGGEGESDCVKHACRIGTAHITSMQRIEPTVNQKRVRHDAAIESAAEILASAKNPVFVGLGNSITETQQKGIKLAEKIGAKIWAPHTELFEDILNRRVKTCTLPDVRDQADVIVFLGADPMNTHPRLLSGYAYYPRGEKRQHGWDVDRTAIAIDLRRSHTAKICREVYEASPHRQVEFMDALSDALKNKVPKTGYDRKRLLKLAGTLKKAEFGVIFTGTYAMATEQERDAIIRLMDELNEVSNFHILPLAPGYNLRSIAALLHEDCSHPTDDGETEQVGRVDQANRVNRANRADLNEADVLLCVGCDLMNSIPAHGINGTTIVIDPNETLTSRRAGVVIPCAAGGIDCAGSALRMDGVQIDLPQTIETERISDARIMDQLMGAI